MLPCSYFDTVDNLELLEAPDEQFDETPVYFFTPEGYQKIAHFFLDIPWQEDTEIENLLLILVKKEDFENCFPLYKDKFQVAITYEDCNYGLGYMSFPIYTKEDWEIVEEKFHLWKGNNN